MLLNLLKSLLRHPFRQGRLRRARSFYEAAMAQKDAGNLAGARRNLEIAVAADPDHALAHYWLGLALARDRELRGAAAHLERALVLEPSLPDGWIDLGNTFAMQRDFEKAVASFRAALSVAPDSMMARVNLGCMLDETGRPEEALRYLREAYQHAPQMEGVLRNFMNVLIQTDRCDEALSVAESAVARDPGSYEAHLALGLARQKLHDPVTALESYETALRLHANDADLHDNRGTALLELGRVPEAIASYERALAARPDFSRAAFHRALARLLLGDYGAGWEDYELRQLNRDYPKREWTYPKWDGSRLEGRALLITREQGLGDEIMFASCLPQLLDQAESCLVECDPRLVPLFRRSFPSATVFGSTPDGSLPADIAGRAIDVTVPAGSVPRHIRRAAADFPRHAGYLKADARAVARWRERLASLGPGLKVGISWTGGVRKTRRGLRSIALERLLPILQTPGTAFVSLQYTADAADAVSALRGRHPVPLEHWRDAIEDYDETAALASALDLIVSVCTAVVHLGGALGRPVWVMSPYSPEWRYGFSGDTMPWYSSVRIFRQPAFDAWDPVISSVASELARLASARSI